MTSLRLGLLAGLVLPLGLATASLAQPTAPPPAPPAGADMHHHWDPAARRAHMADHLRDILQLTPAQDPALNAFLDSMQPPHGEDMHGGDHDRDHDRDQALTTPARLDRMMARMDEMRTRLAAHVAAVKTFYAQLTPSQQKAFDDLAPMMMMQGMHAMHDMHGMHGMDGDGDHRGMGGHDGMHRHHDDDGDHAMGPGGRFDG